MKRFDISGMGVAIITPFDKEGNVDYEALGRVADHIVGNGADYIVVLGTTGESPTLSLEEKTVIRKYIAERIRGRIPLVAGIGGNCTRNVIEEIGQADLDGYSAILSVCPFYNKPTQKGLFAHFKTIAEASPLPIILYNIPGRTGVNLTADTTLKLAQECDNIIGVKEASGDLDQISKIINNAPEGFKVISGDDSLTFDIISRGGNGVISVIGNAYPKLFSEMVKRCLQHSDCDTAKASEIHSKLLPAYKALFADGNPAGIKALLSAAGMIENELRLPLLPVKEEIFEQLRQFEKENPIGS